MGEYWSPGVVGVIPVFGIPQEELKNLDPQSAPKHGHSRETHQTNTKTSKIYRHVSKQCKNASTKKHWNKRRKEGRKERKKEGTKEGRFLPSDRPTNERARAWPLWSPLWNWNAMLQNVAQMPSEETIAVTKRRFIGETPWCLFFGRAKLHCGGGAAPSPAPPPAFTVWA